MQATSTKEIVSQMWNQNSNLGFLSTHMVFKKNDNILIYDTANVDDFVLKTGRTIVLKDSDNFPSLLEKYLP